MWSRIIIYIIGVITGHCYCVKVYTNDCGTVSVAEPAIDGKRVLFTFVPKDQTGISEGAVKWRYYEYEIEYEVPNTTRYNLMAYNASFMMDSGCIKVLDIRRVYTAVYTTSSWECRSSLIKLVVLDAPTDCGILYRQQPKMIQNSDEVVLEYYAPDSVLEHDLYVRNLRRKNSKDCDDKIGCDVDVTWFVEEYSQYNSVYVYRIRNFTDEMDGNYTLQCTNRTHDNKITNYVRLVIPVAPQIPTFLNTKDIDGHENCIAVKENKYVTVRCNVEGGTFPVYVNMSSVGFVDTKECIINKENVTCDWRMKSFKVFHLVGIRCEVSNEATVRPIATTAKFYVLIRPSGPYVSNSQQREGSDIDMECNSWGGQPTPELSMLVNGKYINSTLVSVESSYRRIKLNYLNRNWNGTSLKCCMQHLYYDEPTCTDNSEVSYQFSPESIKIYTVTKATSDKKIFTQTLQCAVINANPACNVNWSYPSTLQVVIGARHETKPAGDGGFTTTSTLQFNGTTHMNSQEMFCQAVCDLFRLSSVAKYNILIPYAIKEEENKEQITLPWIIVGTAASLIMVLLAVIIVFVIVTKRKRRRQNENAAENVSMDVLSHYSNLCRENIGSDIGTYDSLHDVTSPNITDETNPTNTDCPSTDDGAEHAVVIHKSQRQTHGLRDVDTGSTIQQDNHNFVYADLDLNTDGPTANNCVTSKQLKTEYVSIDFNRVGGVGSENIYSNQ